MEKSEILMENGFTRSESLVYLALLNMGRTKSGEVIRKTGLQSSVVHNSLNNLIEKGFVSYILIGKIKHYEAASPGIISEYIAKKKRDYESIFAELSGMYDNRNAEKVSAEVYQGYAGLFSAVLELIEGGKKGDLYRYFSGKERFISEEALEFFEKSDKIKESRGIVTKGIASLERGSKLKGYEASEIKYVKRKIPSSVSIFKDKVLFIVFGDKPICILIKSEEMAKQYSDMWDEIWGN